jgi:Cu/Ag efflux pump CusA
MLTWLLGSAMRLRRLVVAGVVAVLALGSAQLREASLGVYPEFEQTAVQIQTEALGLSAEEVEQLITTPLEQDLLNGIPWLQEIRSESMPGLSAIDLVFDDDADLYLARQMVGERMTQAAALPNVGTPPLMVQPTASTGRTAMISLRSDEVSMVDMSVLARWQLRPRLMSIPGVANVSIWGQRDRQLQVLVDPARLQTRNVTLTQLIETTGNALWVSPLSFVEASTPGTGGFVETPNQRIGVQHVSPITTSDQLDDVAISGVAGAPLRLGDVADVREDHQPLIGDASSDGDRSLMLVVERFPDADLAQVTRDVEAALTAMEPGLSGITVDSDVYRPAGYLESALGRLAVAALIGLALMLVVVAALTFSWRMVVIAATAVATSLVAGLWVLHLRGATLTTMTLLGLAAVVAVVIDDALGDASAIRSRRAERRGGDRSAAAALIGDAVVARRGVLLYATVATLLSLVPLLFLPGLSGAFTRPAALTFALTALASFVVALVVTPTLALLLFRPRDGGARVPPFTRWAQRGYDRTTGRSVGRRAPALLALAALAVLGAIGLPQLASGTQLPELQDRNVLVRLQAAPGTALAEMDRITGAAATELRGLPGVASAGTHVGRAIGADEVVDVDQSEIWLTIAGDADYPATLAAVRNAVAGYPGLAGEVRTYADDQVAVAADSTGDALVVRVFGEDLPTLRKTADQVAEVMETVEGVISPVVEPQASRPGVSVQVDLAAAQRYGIQPGDVRREVSTVVSGLTVGSLYEQQAIFDVVVWGGPPTRSSVNALQSMLIDTPSGQRVRLADVARVAIAPTPSVITHDAVSRSLDVTAEVRGRDAADVAADATARLQRLTFPYEYRAEVLGDATDRADARRAVLLAVVAAAVLVFLLLQAGTNSWRAGAALFVAAPLAAGGALLAGRSVGDADSLGVLVAGAAVVAVAVRQSLGVVGRAQGLLAAGPAGAPADALRQAARDEAAPVLLTALATAAVLLPAALLGGGAGLELLHPFSVALLGGLITSTVVVLFLVPTLLAAVGGLRPAPIVGPDSPDGRPADVEAAAAAHLAKHAPQPSGFARSESRQGSTAMSSGRSWGIASLSLVVGLGLAGCQSAALSAETDGAGAPASVEAAADGGPARLTVTEQAAQRLGLQTAVVGPDAKLPYAAIVYDADGAAWTFVEIEPRAYQRQPVAVTGIDGPWVSAGAGPAPGSRVVTVGAAELVGVEAGISGGE